MKLYYDKRLKDPTYYVQQGFRNGKKTTTKNIKKLGKHSELLRITDDPLSYAKNEIKKMNEEYRSGNVEMNISLNFNEKVAPSDSAYSRSDASNIGYLYLKAIYDRLNLAPFFSSITSDRKIRFDCDVINQFLVYPRILNPRSKYGTYDRLDTYYEKPVIQYQHMIRFMDILESHESEYLAHLYKNSGSIIKRDTSVMYYDCSNYYFESERADEQVMDEVTGEMITGLRQFGASKEHRPNPIVETGLIIDDRGIPVSMCIHPGNTNEQLTAIPLESKVLKMIDGKKFIYCADAGLGSYNIRKFNSMGGKAFIVTQSIKKLSNVLREAVFNDHDYRRLSNDEPMSIKDMKRFDRKDANNLSLYNDKIYKVIEADRAVDVGLYETKTLKNGKVKKVKSKGTLHQRIIITFSRKMMEYQRTIRDRQIERAKNLLKFKDPEKIKKGPNDIRRFLKNKVGPDAEYALDLDKIKNEERYDGFYAVATNLEDEAQYILEVSHKRYKIEDCFRIMKTNFEARPVYHRKSERIRAHFLICYTALLIYRLLECQLEDKGYHITTNDLIETLKNMNVVNMHDIYYQALYGGSEALKALEANHPLMLDRRFYKPKDLNKISKRSSK